MGGEEERRERRVKIALPVRVLGMDVNSRPLRESATTAEISRRGAVLASLGSRIRAGEVISLQFGERKARYRVVWAGAAGTPQHDQLGLEQVNPEDDLFRLDVISPDPHREAVERGTDRRQQPRFQTSLPVELTPEGGRLLRANISDISLSGCYVASLFPLGADTPVTLVFWLENQKLTLRGQVRNCAPGVGFGIAFQDLNAEQGKLLQDHLNQCTPVIDRRDGKAGEGEALQVVRFGKLE